MKQFLIFVKKEFLHIIRDPLTMIILLGLPLLMLTLFGFAITTEVKNTRMAVYDPCRDAATREIIHKLSVNNYFIFTRFLTDPREIETVFETGEVGLVVVFSEQFYENMVHTGEAQVQLIADGTDPNTATTLTHYATNIIASYQQELLKIGTVPYRIIPEIKLLYNPQMKGAYNFVPGVMGMVLMLICAMMTSISIAREKERGTMEVLLVSPMKPLTIILAKAVPYFFLSLVNLSNILLLSRYMLGVPIVGDLAVLVGISMIFIFVCLSLGLLISSMVDTQLVALLISGMALMAPIILLSGMIFPIENMPWFLRILAEIIPARWFIVAVKKIMIKGLDITAILKETAILGGMAVVLIAVSLKKFKNRLE
ncbi:MAG: ABC transporter permease [Chitinivibrionales bacterium]|nr:ABC transporter permease [Chitinivibrionales bacterium]